MSSRATPFMYTACPPPTGTDESKIAIATSGRTAAGVYTNFLDHDEGPDRLAQAFGQRTLQRLGTVKDRYDRDHILGEFPTP